MIWQKYNIRQDKMDLKWSYTVVSTIGFLVYHQSVWGLENGENIRKIVNVFTSTSK